MNGGADERSSQRARRSAPSETAAPETEPAPRRCPVGHPLGPRTCLVGWVPCVSCGGQGHRTWTCQRCDRMLIRPPCRGVPQAVAWTPAAVRLRQRRWYRDS